MKTGFGFGWRSTRALFVGLILLAVAVASNRAIAEDKLSLPLQTPANHNEARFFRAVDWLTPFQKRHSLSDNLFWLAGVTQAHGTQEARIAIVIERGASSERVTVDKSRDDAFRYDSNGGSSQPDTFYTDQRDPTHPPLPYVLRTMRQNVELWIADTRGQKAHRVFARSNYRLVGAQWSSDGRQLLVQGQTIKPKSKTIMGELWVVDANGKGSWLIALGNEVQPQWDTGSSAVLFWRSETVASAAPALPASSFLLYRAAPPWNKPQITPASPVALDGPSPISPDGRRFLCLIDLANNGRRITGPLVIQNIETGKVETFAPHLSLASLSVAPPPYERPINGPVLWSASGQWAMQVPQFESLYDNSIVDAINATKSAFGPSLTSWASQAYGRLAPEEKIIVESGSSMPGEDVFLLQTQLKRHTPKEGGPLVDTNRIRWAWYDPAANQVHDVWGLPETTVFKSTLTSATPGLYQWNNTFVIYPAR